MKRRTITYTEYALRVCAPSATRKMYRRHCRQFTREIERALLAAILRAARQTLREYFQAGKLDKCFRVVGR
jgi:hypothetical protein